MISPPNSYEKTQISGNEKNQKISSLFSYMVAASICFFLLFICVLIYRKRRSTQNNYTTNPHIFIVESKLINDSIAREAIFIYDTPV